MFCLPPINISKSLAARFTYSIFTYFVAQWSQNGMWPPRRWLVAGGWLHRQLRWSSSVVLIIEINFEQWPMSVIRGSAFLSGSGLLADFLATLIKCPPAITKSKQFANRTNNSSEMQILAQRPDDWLVNYFLYNSAPLKASGLGLRGSCSENRKFRMLLKKFWQRHKSAANGATTGTAKSVH